MTTGAAASVEPLARALGEAEQRHADVFVVFGITGDLARADDLPLSLPARAARPPLLPRRRSGLR